MKRVLFIRIGFIALGLSAFAANVTLAWDTSPSTGITNYSVYYGTATGAYTNQVNAGTNLSVTVSNLVNGVKYYFAATALDTHGMESAYSAEINYTIPWPRPAAPSNLRLVSASP
jgi:hypothetical protein